MLRGTDPAVSHGEHAARRRGVVCALEQRRRRPIATVLFPAGPAPGADASLAPWGLVQAGADVVDIKIEERVVGGVTVLDIAGRLTIDSAAVRLKDKINSLIEQQRTHIVANLKDVPYIDSGGLGQLVASYGSVMKAGGALKLLNVSSRNHDLLSITRLVTLFESFESEAEAVRSFQTTRAAGGTP
jgi:anti-sigma B factor antagonist